MNKACVLFLIDDSTPMQFGAVDAACSRMDCIATAINLILRQLANGTPIDIGLVGYHQDEQGVCVINTCWGRPFDGKRWVSSSSLAQHPLRVEYRPQPIFDPLTQTVRYENMEFPIWYEARPSGLPMSRMVMFDVLASMLQDWCSKVPHPSAAPLIVSFLSDVFPDERISTAVKALSRVNTPMGIPTLFQFHLGVNVAMPPLKYPNDPQFLPPGPLQDLFFACSPLTDSMQNVLRQNQELVYPMAKGMVFNGRSADLFHFMSLVRHYQGQLPIDMNAASIPMPEILMDSSIFQSLDGSNTGSTANPNNHVSWEGIFQPLDDDDDDDDAVPVFSEVPPAPASSKPPVVPPAPPTQSSPQSSPQTHVPPTPPPYSNTQAHRANGTSPLPPEVNPALLHSQPPQGPQQAKPAAPALPPQPASAQTASAQSAQTGPHPQAATPASSQFTTQPTPTQPTPAQSQSPAVSALEMALPPGFDRSTITPRDRVMFYQSSTGSTVMPQTGFGEPVTSTPASPAAPAVETQTAGNTVSDAEIDLTLNQSMPSIHFSTDTPMRAGGASQFEEALPPGVDAASFRGTARWRSWRVTQEETTVSNAATPPSEISGKPEVPSTDFRPTEPETQPSEQPTFDDYNIPPEPGTARWRFWKDFHPNTVATVPTNYEFRCQRLPKNKLVPEPAKLLPRQSLVVLLVDRSVSDLTLEPAQKMWAHRLSKVAFMLGEFARCGRRRYDVALVYYGQNARGETEVVSNMLGRPFVSDEVLLESAGRVEPFVVQYPNGIGGLISLPRRRLHFSSVTPTLPADPVPAFTRVAEIIREWKTKRSQRILPPAILHITGGMFQRSRCDEAFRRLPWEDCGGDTPRDNQPPMWLMHWVFTERPHVGVCCPDDAMFTEYNILRFLWERTSMLPGRRLLADVRPGICPQSRGMMVNMDFEVLFEVLDTLAARKTGKMKD